MIDLHREFRVLDRIEAPPLESDIDARLRHPGREHGLPPVRPHRRRMAAIVALALFAAAGAFAWRTWERVQAPRPALTSPAGDPWAWASEGWTELLQPPDDRAGATYVWTGDHLLYWGGVPRAAGGESLPLADGYAFDPRARTWSAIPPAPVPGVLSVGIWTGSEALFLPQNEDGLLAYEPGGRTWRRLADPIHEVRGDAFAWTGRER